jgi:hypothetical protein
MALCFHFIFDRLTKFWVSGGVGSTAVADQHSPDEEENEKLKKIGPFRNFSIVVYAILRA